MGDAREPFEELSVEELRARGSIKWTQHGPDVLPLWVAEMDAMPPAAVADELRRLAATGDLGYPPLDTSYAECFAALAAARWGWSPDPALSCAAADVVTGVHHAVVATTSPGDTVVVPTPVYPPLLLIPAEAGRAVAQVPLSADGRLDLEALGAAMADPAATALLLCSPHNPTGTVHTADELRALGALAAEHGVTVISDEIHALLVHGGEPFVPWLAVNDAGLVVTSASKAYNTAGLKAAVLLAGPGSAALLEALPESTKYGSSYVGQRTHMAAWSGGDAWLAAVNGAIAANAAYLGDLLAEHLPAVGYRPPASTYLAWLDCRALDLGDDPAAVFLERGRVALNPGPTFGDAGAGFVRLNLAASRAVLADAVRRMSASL